MESMKIDRAKLTWLNGGVTHLDGGAMFGVVPRALWSKKYPVNEKNQIELRTDPILLQIDGLNILIDSGIGNEKVTDKQRRNFGIKEESNVASDLSELNLSLEDINIVCMTHLHFDHACGLTTWKNGELTPTFPNAKIFVQSVEWKEMKHPNIRSANTYWEDNWKPIETDVHTYENEVEIAEGLKMIHTSGHSDGHAIILFEGEEETFVHMADIMPTHAHQNPLWALAFDDYPVTSVHEKQKWMAYGYENSAWYIFYHDAIYRAIKYDAEGQVVDRITKAPSVYDK
ncbi:MBL fold metallo-hydrolase [Halobacillus sp. A1]|uniref:YtnP family quorum-quenching lactonase n=1 Tax=Halobacillus sp. A1 TaxID=2880262 RepID=UPI0020A6D0F3|nr:MBL fold metallo-hydrolase [Halobacillus sp. A1]MCP3033104.1 MBL fold metallo-hydrolase [Halobacillus sp. A1]